MQNDSDTSEIEFNSQPAMKDQSLLSSEDGMILPKNYIRVYKRHELVCIFTIKFMINAHKII